MIILTDKWTIMVTKKLKKHIWVRQGGRESGRQGGRVKLTHLSHFGSGIELDIGPIHVWNPPTPLHWNVDHRQLDVHILYWNKVLMVGLVVEIFLVFWKSNINKSSQQDSNDHSPLNLFRHRQYTNRALLNEIRRVTTSTSSSSSSTATTTLRVGTWWPWGVFWSLCLLFKDELNE